MAVSQLDASQWQWLTHELSIAQQLFETLHPGSR